jgi:hypothetical protein
MGLHQTQFEDLISILSQNKIEQVVEFGSGGSTDFLCSYRDFSGLNYSIVSYDHSSVFSYQGKHDFLDLRIKDLVKCSDEDFDLSFKNKKIIKEKFHNCQNEENNFRIKNCFYDLDPEELPNSIDLIILDGPNGNGRSLAFPFVFDHISHNCWLLIDDSNHYDFLERCQSVFQTTIIKKISNSQIHPLFSYCLLKIYRK